uniref:SMP-LTD domain-containing protein n=1 Tax=Haptolina brevifila TaxID=156173 RepID=A0A7S2BSF1_9EUKA|mmetsp:Transcript_16028/g.32160  ORF Transcript_16028/g.32160 Transcript_16028/m.32160 type:complete len:609 (+) Transcript_16028:737-2563(+)
MAFGRARAGLSRARSAESSHAAPLATSVGTWQQPAFFNEMWRRVWAQAHEDYSRRLQCLLEKGASKLLEADGFGEIKVKVDVGKQPWTFEWMRMDGDDSTHVRAEAWFEWCGGASIELSFDTNFISVPLLISDLTLRGPMRLQATPQHYAPYLGHCSISFLQPPQIDFTLRALRTFDVMEVPLLAQRLKATADKAFIPMIWPRQLFFQWHDLVDSPIPHRLHVHLLSLHPPPSSLSATLTDDCSLPSTRSPSFPPFPQALRSRTSAQLALGEGARTSGAAPCYFLVVSLSEKQYDQTYTTAELHHHHHPSAAMGSIQGVAVGGISICEEPSFALEAPHLLPRLRVELHEKREGEGREAGRGREAGGAKDGGESASSVLGRAEVPISAADGGEPLAVTIGRGWVLQLTLKLNAPPPPQHVRSSAILHVRRISLTPPAFRGLVWPLRLQLRAGTWETDLGGSTDGEWPLNVFIPIPRPDTQPLYATILTPYSASAEEAAAAIAASAVATAARAADSAAVAEGEVARAPKDGDEEEENPHGPDQSPSHRAVGTARVALEDMVLRAPPCVLWAPLQPSQECAIRVECAMLDRASAAWAELVQQGRRTMDSDM